VALAQKGIGRKADNFVRALPETPLLPRSADTLVDTREFYIRFSNHAGEEGTPVGDQPGRGAIRTSVSSSLRTWETALLH
jgi:hypothetical protein